MGIEYSGCSQRQGQALRWDQLSIEIQVDTLAPRLGVQDFKTVLDVFLGY